MIKFYATVQCPNCPNTANVEYEQFEAMCIAAQDDAILPGGWIKVLPNIRINSGPGPVACSERCAATVLEKENITEQKFVAERLRGNSLRLRNGR